MKKLLYFSLTAMLILAVTLSGYGGGRVTGAEATRYFAYAVHANQSYLSCYSIDAATGDLKEISAVVPAKSASSVQSITADPSGRFVYTANLNSDNVSAFSINATTGKLTEITGSPFAAGDRPTSITADPTGKFVYVTNESSNTVSAYSINPATGALTKISDSPTGTWPRSVTVAPSGKFVYVANSSSDNISAFSINATTGLLTKITGSPFAAGDVPQSITADPSGRFVYVANRGSKTISAFSMNASTGALTKITGSPFSVGNLLNDITVDPSGKFLFVTTDVTTTGRNVSGYSINAATGALTIMIGSPYVAGFSPLGMAFDPSGKYFYVANYGSKTISAFTINPVANLLTPNFACAFASSWPVAIVTVKPPAPDLSHLPDLVFTNVAITSRTDTEINYAYTIKNVGGGTIPSLYNVCIQNIFSANTTFLDSGDKAAGGSILAVDRPLAPGESYSGTFGAYGSAVPSGMLYLMGQIDWGNSIPEIDETNNTFALLIPSIPDLPPPDLSHLPDLVIANVTITSRTDTGLDYSYTIKNIGNGTIPSQQDVKILSYYSANTIPDDSGDVYAYGFIIRLDHSLAPGESYSSTFWTSGAVPAGMNYLTFQIDRENVIAEANETNNTFAVWIP